MELNGERINRAETKEFFQALASPMRAFGLLCDPAHPHYRLIEKALYALDKMDAFLDDDFRTLWRMEQHEAEVARAAAAHADAARARAEQSEAALVEAEAALLKAAARSDSYDGSEVEQATSDLAYLSTFSEVKVPSIDQWLGLRKSLRDYILKRAEVYEGSTKGREAAYALKVALMMKEHREKAAADTKVALPSPIVTEGSVVDVTLSPPFRPVAPSDADDAYSYSSMPPLVAPGWQPMGPIQYPSPK